MRGVSVVLRRLIHGGASSPVARSSLCAKNLVLSSAVAVSYSTLFTDDAVRPAAICDSVASDRLQTLSVSHFRNFSSSAPASDSSNVVVIESEEQFNDSLRKAQGKLLSPIIGQLSEIYPHVTTLKIDIDKEALGTALSKLNIHSVPTLQFFHNGKKASEVVGADVQRVKETMESLYK
ncbi:hypothetical protein M569_14112 [Genlisea aurea]|uniref:Thioredoxin domain-containing protein n=1 Tax=Genlisea aurea TaxID=192259 RepID=S8DM59_9LAMI|nr:hypothetical protein M569_14112 [Genlisea aurea]